MNRSLTVKTGNCNHRRYIPSLLEMVRSGMVDLTPLVTQRPAFGSVIDAHEAFDTRRPGWIKVELKLAA